MVRYLSIKGWTGYRAGSDGTIWSIKRKGVWKELKGGNTHGGRHNGYKNVILSDGSRRWCVTVHKLIWITFKGPVPAGYEINHKNSNRKDNRLSNLELVTHLRNVQHSVEKGRHAHHERHGRAVLTARKVRRIRRWYAIRGYSQDRLSKIFGVGQTTISAIVRRLIWKNI